jgi:hypothetical protein
MGRFAAFRPKGDYPFSDGMIEVTYLEIKFWTKNPEALFELMRKNPVRDQVEYVLGKPTCRAPDKDRRPV